MMIFPRKFLILMLRSLRIGMMRKMVNGLPTIPNPEYKGPWKQNKIKNPNYEDKWKAPMIDNPDFKDDPYIYAFDSLKYIDIELWQVKSGTLFDNILITDDPKLAKTFAEETWGKHKDAEKAALAEAEKKK